MFELRALSVLDLSHNQIESIPEEAFDPLNDELMSGTSLYGNVDLSLSDLVELQDYARRVNPYNNDDDSSGEVLGFNQDDIQRMINRRESWQGAERGRDEEGAHHPAPVPRDEVIYGVRTANIYLEPWLHNLPPADQVRNTQIWGQLAAEPGNSIFFNLINLLQDTKDFRLARASLTRRVWAVMDAAARDAAVRDTMFAASATHGTCGDGRILTFSGLEAIEHEVKTLRGIDPTDFTGRGRTLWELSRDLFYRGQVEALAARHTAGQDAAEVRLEYLIGLKKRLTLPGVPDTMLYGTPISGESMETEALRIERMLRMDVFY